MSDNETESVLGQECHICAKNKKGPRFNPQLTEKEIDDYENLLLLCSKHHRIIDENPDYYSVDVLRKIKKDHENEIRKQYKESGKEINKRSFSFKDYYVYLENLVARYPANEYINRQIYKESEDCQLEITDVLISEKRVLLTGEAGFGKTYESINAIRMCMKDTRFANKIPVLLFLEEYDLLYQDIYSGICKRLESFCEDDYKTVITEYLKNGNVILILDGIDDISSSGSKNKFFFDFNDFSAKYCDNMMLLTMRSNRYGGEFGTLKQYFLTELDIHTINRELNKEGIYIDIPQDYYKLFANPLFLSIGKQILKNNRKRRFFNRSQLFDALFCELFDSSARKNKENENLTYNEALNILGKFAYESFTKPTYSKIEFDKLMSECMKEDRASSISSFVNSGIFVFSDRIMFVHKLFKEYFAAHYLINYFPIECNISLYESLAIQDDWKEVMIFTAGLCNDLASQDMFLDLVMKLNFHLYVQSVNSKNDLINKNIPLNESDLAMRLLKQLYDTYTFAVSNYFYPIANLFSPDNKNIFIERSKRKLGIKGCITKDRKGLAFWYDVVDADEESIICFEVEKYSHWLEASRKRMHDIGRSLTIHNLSLGWSDLQEDSGRAIALNEIKSTLKRAIDNRKLIESPHLLCERVHEYRRNLDIIRDSIDIAEMKRIVDEKVEKHLKAYPNMKVVSSRWNDIFSLKKILDYMVENEIKLDDYSLPGGDLDYYEHPTPYLCNRYSQEQKVKQLSYFFYFHEIAYLYMIKENFPVFYKTFLRYKDTPYQVVINLFSEDVLENEKVYDPKIEYYYIASLSNEIPMPRITVSSTDDMQEERHRIIFSEIQDSYTRIGKTAHNVHIVETGFNLLMLSPHTGDHMVLSEYVYKTIREGLEEIFGKF